MTTSGAVLNYNHLYKVLSRKSSFAPCDEVLKRIVILALLAGLADGSMVREELDVIKGNIINRFKKSEKDLLSYLGSADIYIDNCDSEMLFELVSEELRSRLTQSQLLEVCDFLSDVVLADNSLSFEEEKLLNRLIEIFELDAILAAKRPNVNNRGIYWEG